MVKKVFALILSLLIIASLTVIPTAAKTDENYPFVFVHGLMGWGSYDGINDLIPYWGCFKGDMLSYLGENGYVCCSASTGKLSSAWDRACELYAQLNGTTVDYGEAHSKEYGHTRYGRTYSEPLLEGFSFDGTGGLYNKINLVGHSFGGQAVRMLTYLLEYGNAQECEKSGNDTSPLFTGGKGNFINSVTTLNSPHNGTTGDDRTIPVVWLLENMFYTFFGFLSNTPLRPMWDMQLEQYGLTDTDDFNGMLTVEGIKKLKNTFDNSINELTVDGAYELNKGMDTVEGVYYYSYYSECVTQLGDSYIPSASMNPIFLSTSRAIINKSAEDYGCFVTDNSWKVNDGIVNSVSAMYPYGEDHTEYDSSDTVPGIWNVMPMLHDFDHNDYMGMLTNGDNLREFYINMCKTVCNY